MPNPNEWAGIFEFPFFARKLFSTASTSRTASPAKDCFLNQRICTYTVDNFVTVRTMYSEYVGGNQLSPTFLNLQLSFE